MMTLPMRFKEAALLAVTTLVLGATLHAFATTILTGVVTDSTGAVLVGVEVTARQVETGITRQTVSGPTGRFELPAMPLGSYVLRAEAGGFRTLVREGVNLVVGETAVVNLVMEVGPGDSQEVVVRANASLLQTETSDLSYVVGQRTLEQLPLNGRNYTDLALLQPGVSAFRNRDSFGSVVAHGLGTSVNGRDPRSNVYLLDGTLQNDFTNGPAGSAASTALGLDTIQEFQVATNNYSAEFGRNFGGQINVVTKSGANLVHGSVFYFHRNDNLDARNFFDRGDSKPEFKRHQFGVSLGGPIRKDKTFYFFGYEGLREGLGRSLTTVVPDENARMGLLPDASQPGGLRSVGVDPAVAPYLLEFPLPNGPSLGGGLAVHDFRFNQDLDEDFVQGRIDHAFGDDQFFARYTFDDGIVALPTDYPQFPRSFQSRNQFGTAEYRWVVSSKTVATFRGNLSRTRIGQDVQANTSSSLPPFVPTRGLAGDIDIGGLPRFGPQISVDVALTQNVFGFDFGLSQSADRHSLRFGALAEHYQDNMVNPTFSLGVFSFNNLEGFLRNQPQRFLGLAPEGALDRYWRFNLFGFYVQDDFRVNRRLTLNFGLRYEFSTVPQEIYDRDVSLPNLLDPEPTVGPLYKNSTLSDFAPRVGLAWDLFGDGSTALRAGYGLFHNTSNQQNLIVTVTNPPFTPRLIIPNPTFPVPPFERGIGNSLRPIQYDLDTPEAHIWNVNLQRRLWAETLVTVGYAGSRGVHLLRNTDLNVPVPERLPDGTLFYAPNTPRPNSNFSTIEEKVSDGNSWYNALLVEIRKRWNQGFSFQSSYTFSRSIDTTQASTFFSDASNGTTNAFPEFVKDYNKGLSDFHAQNNWVFHFLWEVPFAHGLSGLKGALLDGWQLSGIANLQSGNPLTVFVRSNRSRSLWSPSILPGLGFDRPNLTPGFTHESAVTGNPDSYFNPAAFTLQPAGTFGDLGRGAFIGPNLRTFDFQASKNVRWAWQGEDVNLQFRVEFFNLFNRANFAPPSLLAFAGVQNGEAPLPTLGQIRSTSTSARQIQFGLRLSF